MDQDEAEPLDLIKCFPSLTNLKISWSLRRYARRSSLSLSPTVQPYMGLPHLHRLQICLHSDFLNKDRIGRSIREVRSLFCHLPLSYVKHIGVFFEDFASSRIEPGAQAATYYQQLATALESMRFPDLESFHLGFDFLVFGVPFIDIWVRRRELRRRPCADGQSQESLELVVDSVLESTTATAISIRPRLAFDSADDSVAAVFLEVGGDITLHPVLLPTRDVLVGWARRVKSRHPKLESFKVTVSYTTFQVSRDDFLEPNEMLRFEYRDGEEDGEDYERPVNQENVDLRSQSVDADVHEFRYQVYTDNIMACHRRLIQDAAILRQDRLRRAEDDAMDVDQGEFWFSSESESESSMSESENSA